MAGTGRLAEETRLPLALNEISPRWKPNLQHLRDTLDCTVSFENAQDGVPWERETLIFSPPYYPKADRCRPAGHNDEKRGAVVGFRDSYGDGHLPGFIGDPAGKNAILLYRNAMRKIFFPLGRGRTRRMLLVTKNWTRLGTEMRLDLDLFLTAQEAGWRPEARTGWVPPASLWARYNERRGGMITVEDVLVLTRNP